MKRKLTLTFLSMATVLMLSSPLAQADILTFSLISPMAVGPGGSVDFTATVTAPITNSAALFLNGDSASIDAPLTLDDAPFFANFPFFLDPGDSFTGVLFTVHVPNLTPVGTYDGHFALVGGADGGANDLLTPNVAFEVNVTPEPGSWLLLATICSVLIAGIGRKFRQA